MAFELSSPAFAGGQAIPRQYTCDGEDVSPPLRWTEPPPRTRYLALIVEDPDAPRGTFTHWVLYDVPVSTRHLDEGVPGEERLPTDAKQGVNDFTRVGYGGPCPPRGRAHRYRFTLYALDRPTELGPRATKQKVVDVIRGHVLAEATLMGRYERQSR